MPAPGAPTGASLNRVSGDSQIRLTFSYSGTLATSFDVQYWNNVYNGWQFVEPVGENDRSKTINSSANRRYIMRVRAVNGDGKSSWAQSNAIQTTPAGPSNVTAAKSGPRDILVRWSNGAQTLNGYAYNSMIEEKVSGGAWTPVATVAGGVRSLTRSNLAVGETYTYRVQARSTVHDTLYSGFTTMGATSVQIFDYPAAPSALTVTRFDDARYDLSWTNNPTSVAPYGKVLIQRTQDDGVTWVTVASLDPSITSFSDTSTAQNRRYLWRMRAENEVGPSAWVTSDPFQTTPTEPSINSVVAVPGGGLQVSWTNAVGYSNYTTYIRHYEDGVLVAGETMVASGTSSYTLSPVALTSTYRFELQARSTVGGNLNSPWVASSDTPASTVPAAPSVLSPNGVPIDFERDQDFTWQHNPTADGAAQSKYEIQYSTDAGATWTSTGQIASDVSLHTMLADTLANTDAVSWQVRTWGIHTDPSAWSDAALVVGSTTPVVSILTPTSPHQYSSVDVTWSFFDQEGTSQSAWEVNLLDSVLQVVESRVGDDAGTAVTLYTTVEDDTNYTLRVRGKDGSGLWSDWAELSLAVDYVPPQLPLLTVDFASGSGYAVLTLTPDPEDTSSIPATSVSILRRETLLEDPEAWGEWVVIAEGLPPEATVTDTSPALGDRTEYMAISYAEV